MRRRVLVTGGCGYVGRHAVAALVDDRFEVHSASRNSTARIAGATYHTVDLLDPAAARTLIDDLRPTHLLLSAWTTSHGAFWTDPANERWTEACISLARRFFTEGGERAVLAGTCAEYDWTDPIIGQGPIRETTALAAPLTIYGRAKRLAGDDVMALAAQHGGTFSDGRIFFPMGADENERRFLPSIIRAQLYGHPVDLSSGDQVRDIIDVRDAGAALAALVQCHVNGAVNIGTGRGVRLSDIARRVGELGGRPDLLRLGALPMRKSEPATLVADVDRLKDEVMFRPRHSLDDTLQSAFSYWREKLSVPVST